MGIILVYQSSELTAKVWSALPYFSISLSLNVLLTLMIVIRLILHTRNIRAAMGIAGSGRLSKAIVTMLIESCALYCELSVVYCTVGRPQLHRGYFLAFPRSDPGSCFPTIPT